jgi:hypothetical protein
MLSCAVTAIREPSKSDPEFLYGRTATDVLEQRKNVGATRAVLNQVWSNIVALAPKFVWQHLPISTSGINTFKS